MKFPGHGNLDACSAGQDAWLYGSQDGRRYGVTNNLGTRGEFAEIRAVWLIAEFKSYRS